MIEYPELEKVLQSLPSVAQRELLDFLGYLQYKYRLDQSRPVLRLGGLWADVDFDVDDEDVRNLRREITLQLADKV